MKGLMLALALLSGAAVAAPPRKVALLVGANQPIDGRAPLRFAHRDAERLAQALVEVAGFAKQDVQVLLEPTPAQVLEAVAQQQARLQGAEGETVSLFYFSGHADAQALYSGGQPVPLEALKERLEGGPAQLRLGILDACHGGGWTRAKGLTAAPASAVPVVKLLSAQGTALLASSSGLEAAHESEALRASFFTHHLIAALRGAAEQTPAGEVTLQAAYRYAHERTVRDSALYAQAPQHPSFELNLHGRRDVVLAQVSGGPSQLTVSQSEGPIQLLELPSGDTVLELPEGSRTVRLAVPAGRYLLRRQIDASVYGRELTVEAGKTVEVSEASLALVGTPLLAAKGKIFEHRWDLDAALQYGMINGGGLNAFSLALAGTYRVLPRWAVRAKLGGGTFFYEGEPISGAGGQTTHVVYLGQLSVQAVVLPVRAAIGASGLFELQLGFGPGLLVSKEQYADPLTAGFAPVVMDLSLQFFFNERFGGRRVDPVHLQARQVSGAQSTSSARSHPSLWRCGDGVSVPQPQYAVGAGWPGE